MATSPIEHLSGLVIGVVESVAPDRVRVVLELDTPHTTALNTGSPVAFPRLNGYVLIPHEAGATVAYISWIGIERSPYPKRSGLKDFGLIDLPFPMRIMAVSPVATLVCKRARGAAQTQYELARGVIVFPSVGDQVLIPTAEQVEAIVGAKDTDKRVRLGTSPLGTNAPIMVDPDKMFGRHLAVLGNTGSGKSCTVAGLIRWSMAAAVNEIKAAGGAGTPNARFIVLDPNGEYSAAFRDRATQVRVYKISPDVGEGLLDVPAWAMNGHEWAALSNAAPGAQKPLLMQGLRELKSGVNVAASRQSFFKGYLRSFSAQIADKLEQGLPAMTGLPKARGDCGRFLQRLAEEATLWAAELELEIQQAMHDVAQEAVAIMDRRRSRNDPRYFDDFAISDFEQLKIKVDACVEILPGRIADTTVGEDAPRYFDASFLAEHLNNTAIDRNAAFANFVATLGLRIKGMFADQYLGDVINRQPPTTLDAWLNDYIGSNHATNGQVAIIDLSLVPSDVVHNIVAVLGRLVFESLQRYRRAHPDGKCLPTALVLEEAHTFVRRSFDDANPAHSAATLCRETFERIAREGRKFGLGLVVSSQRPSELSPTVLAQCNTFILHRIVNDADQSLVARLVPDNVAGLLQDLPSLPSKQAVVLGWATPMPVLVEVAELPEDHRPRSADPDFWDVWTKKSPREVDWPAIAAEWSGDAAAAGAAPPAVGANPGGAARPPGVNGA